MKKAAQKKLEQGIRLILLEEWDPLAISEVPEAANEYDSYVPYLIKLLIADTNETRIASHLLNLQKDAMGLSYDSVEARLRTAKRLRALNE